MEKIYSVKEASEKTNIPPRSISYYCKRDKVRKKSNKYQITQKILDEWVKDKPTNIEKFATLQETCETLLKNNEALRKTIQSLRAENKELKELKEKSIIPHQQKLKEAIQLITLEAMEQNVQHKIFTEEEYTDIIGTISEVDFQKEQVNYLRKRVEKQDEILNELVRQSGEVIAEKRESNFIKAKEKGFDKK